MVYEKILHKLLSENSKTASEEAIELLSKIADNILKDPSNPKLRTLKKNNSIVSSKILPAKGAVECLKLMGFHENRICFTMPVNTSLTNLQIYKNEIINWKNHVHTGDVPNPEVEQHHSYNTESLKNDSHIQKAKLPPLVLTYSNPFLRRIETYFHSVLQYEDKNLRERVRKLVPLMTLEENAQRRLRSIQELVKKNKLIDPQISVQDTLILELLRWFKEEFFQWVDSPECSNCKGETTYSHMSTDHDLLTFTDRVELHRCKTCHQFTPFPRYTDLNILLETRRGRCGEWANTFTLLCRAMDWDARYVVDEGDHVWTEVYSVTQKRWLHCDPCENVCDTPLLYENGWHKNISYVISYSADEVQDVTWRYSSNHKGVLKNRKNCSEVQLLDALFTLRSLRQKQFSDARRRYLTKRLLSELVEFLTERKPTSDEEKGRSSGSAFWRLTRGEIQNTVSESQFIWQINDEKIIDNQIIIRYSASLDRYECSSGDKSICDLKGWNAGAFKYSGIFRKEEKDWKMVYLARMEGYDLGNISWKIELVNSSKYIDTIVLNFNYTTFENAVVNVEINSGSNEILLPNGNTKITLQDLNSSSITISASLSGGKGDAAWQQAQLFRQPSDSSDFPFTLTATFK